jgi:hypothetical protein
MSGFNKEKDPPEHVFQLWLSVLAEANKKYDTGDFSGAADLYHRTYMAYPTDKTLIYNAACSWALAGNKERAFEDIELWMDSHKGGISWPGLTSLKTDKDFQNLHRYPEWQKLLQGLEKDLTDKEHSYFWGFYFGILFILFFHNLFLFFSIKDNSYLYYALLILAIVHFEAFRTPAFGSVLARYFWGLKYVMWIRAPFPFFVNLLIIFNLLFVNSFLKLKSNLPLAHKLVKVLLVYFSIAGILFTFSLTPLAKLNEKVVFLTFLFLFISGIICWRKGYKPARFFVLATVIITASTTMHLLEQLGVNVVITRIGVFHVDNVGMIFFFALLSFALGDRINILTAEKNEAQKKALEKLEQLVDERTKEVVEKSMVIEEKNKDILASIHYAKRIQSSLITSQKYIEKNLERLKNRNK